MGYNRKKEKRRTHRSPSISSASEIESIPKTPERRARSPKFVPKKPAKAEIRLYKTTGKKSPRFAKMQESRIEKETSGDETEKDTKNIQKTTIRHDNRPKWMKKGQENKVKSQKKKTYEKAVKAHYYQYSEIRYRNDSGLGNNNSKKDKKQ